MKKIFIAITISAVLGQFLGSIATMPKADAQDTTILQPGIGLRYLPFFSYI